MTIPIMGREDLMPWDKNKGWVYPDGTPMNDASGPIEPGPEPKRYQIMSCAHRDYGTWDDECPLCAAAVALISREEIPPLVRIANALEALAKDRVMNFYPRGQ